MFSLRGLHKIRVLLSNHIVNTYACKKHLVFRAQHTRHSFGIERQKKIRCNISVSIERQSLHNITY